MERRVRGNSHARCETGEKVESGADAPLRPYLSSSWRPSDLSQRLGRIVRQGNENPEVEIFRYVTEGTFDAYLYVRHEVALFNCSAKTEPAIPLAVA